MSQKSSITIIVALGIAVGVCGTLAGVAWAQTGRATNRQGILPAEAYLADRDSHLQQELARLKESESVMGPNHPKLAEVQRRIVECEKELQALQALPNPLARLEEEGAKVRDIVEQISEKELRGLAVRLALDLRDLRKRVEALERANPVR